MTNKASKATCTENFESSDFGHGIFEICKQTNRHTHTHTHWSQWFTPMPGAQ